MKGRNEESTHKEERASEHSTSLLVALALAFLLGAALTGYLGWTLMPK